MMTWEGAEKLRTFCDKQLYINLCYHKERNLVNAGRWISKKEWKFPGKPDKIEIWRRPIKLLHPGAKRLEKFVTDLIKIRTDTINLDAGCTNMKNCAA